METPNREACGLLSDPNTYCFRAIAWRILRSRFLNSLQLLYLWRLSSGSCSPAKVCLGFPSSPELVPGNFNQQGTRSLVEGKLLDVLGNFGVYLQACRTGNTLQCAMWYVRVA